jgi:hypothetical protein
MKKQVGINFLHTHPISEQKFGIDEKHVIVDKEDYDILIEYLKRENISIDEDKSILKYNKEDLNWLYRRIDGTIDKNIKYNNFLLSILNDNWIKRIYNKKKIINFLKEINND